MRFRNVFMLIGGLLVITIMFLTDPDGGLLSKVYFGSSTISTLIIALMAILYISLLHIGRKGLLDYINLEEIYKKCMLTPESAGLFAIAVGLIHVAIAICIYAAVK